MIKIEDIRHGSYVQWLTIGSLNGVTRGEVRSIEGRMVHVELNNGHMKWVNIRDLSIVGHCHMAQRLRASN